MEKLGIKNASQIKTWMKWHRTDHEDPRDYLQLHGVSEFQFRSNVQRAYNNEEVAT